MCSRQMPKTSLGLSCKKEANDLLEWYSNRNGFQVLSGLSERIADIRITKNSRSRDGLSFYCARCRRIRDESSRRKRLGPRQRAISLRPGQIRGVPAITASSAKAWKAMAARGIIICAAGTESPPNTLIRCLPSKAVFARSVAKPRLRTPTTIASRRVPAARRLGRADRQPGPASGVLRVRQLRA
jgi:hypothetical protein